MIKIDTVYKRGILFVRLYGVINKDTKKEIEKTLEIAIQKAGIKYLLLNLENIYYVNSNISSFIHKWSKVLKEKEGRFFICGYDLLQKNNYIKINEDTYSTKDEFSVFSMVNI